MQFDFQNSNGISNKTSYQMWLSKSIGMKTDAKICQSRNIFESLISMSGYIRTIFFSFHFFLAWKLRLITIKYDQLNSVNRVQSFDNFISVRVEDQRVPKYPNLMVLVVKGQMCANPNMSCRHSTPHSYCKKRSYWKIVSCLCSAILLLKTKLIRLLTCKSKDKN